MWGRGRLEGVIKWKPERNLSGMCGMGHGRRMKNESGNIALRLKDMTGSCCIKSAAVWLLALGHTYSTAWRLGGTDMTCKWERFIFQRPKRIFMGIREKRWRNFTGCWNCWEGGKKTNMSEKISCKGNGHKDSACQYDSTWFCNNPRCKSPVLTSTLLGARPSGCPKTDEWNRKENC